MARKNIRSPVESVAAIVDSTTAFRWIVNGAKILPLRGTHFWTGLCRAWRGFAEQAHDKLVGFLNEESAEFVEPKVAVHTFRWGGDQTCGLASNCDFGIRCWAIGVMMV